MLSHHLEVVGSNPPVILATPGRETRLRSFFGNPSLKSEGSSSVGVTHVTVAVSNPVDPNRRWEGLFLI